MTTVHNRNMYNKYYFHLPISNEKKKNKKKKTHSHCMLINESAKLCFHTALVLNLFYRPSMNTTALSFVCLGERWLALVA